MQTNEPGSMTDGSQLVYPQSWVANHADYLYNYAIARLNDAELARDLVQETFLGALERLQGFEGRSTERTWLTAILRNKIIDIYRKRSSGLANHGHAIDEERGPDDFFNPDDGHWTLARQPQDFARPADDPLLTKEFQLTLRACLDRLPAMWLAVFTMKHMEDESTDVICKELKVSASNFWVIIHRAKVNLRACLQKNWI
ncbi:MAG: sigma-70 family RNA polymerase sigma factor [Chitinophagaceae bacterium]|nr:MAG: sigma-70 family RNA polymerase sigma factor [Chitinophagaceae bacterium]